ncbi:MAG: esterase [Clostridia bacterium]|nr:esterase [Clostridia bacterium]
MDVYEYGDPSANALLIQPVDDHDLALLERETAAIREGTSAGFRLLAVRVGSWNADLSPWDAPPVFGKEGFGHGAAETLREVEELCRDAPGERFIGGYSLAGLFALWAAHQTDLFSGVAAASPSVWFPGFTEFMRTHPIRTGAVYLSLGDREDRTRNPVMATVKNRILEARDRIEEQGADCALEWNRGNHFMDPDLRTARAFAWLLDRRRT